MTEQEAKERLECLKLYMQICDKNNDEKFLAEDYEAINIAIKTLNKS